MNTKRRQERTSADVGMCNDSILGGLWAAFAPSDWATDWYWPLGVRGKAWSFFHGYGWRITGGHAAKKHRY